jgi:hypothetical protein
MTMGTEAPVGTPCGILHEESKNKQNSPFLAENCRLTAARDVGDLSPTIKPLLTSDLNTDSASA